MKDRNPDGPEAYVGNPDFTQNPTMENPIIVGEWRIWKWTGWKSQKGSMNYPEGHKRLLCRKCEKIIKQGEPIAYIPGTFDQEHFRCSGLKPTYVGQWLAFKGEKYDQRCSLAFSSVPGACGTYERGDSFSIEPEGEQKLILETTSPNVMNIEREKGLERLKLFLSNLHKLGG